MEPLLRGETDILNPSDYNYTVSFIGTTMAVDSRFYDSVTSINLIAEELGRDFEIVVSHPPPDEASRELLRKLRKDYHSIMFIEHDLTGFGQGKRISFQGSSGKFIVPFCTSIIYPIGYADILHNFLQFKLKRLYYSELPLVSREIVQEVGGWRDLLNGEDIDLYSRISTNYGLFACPTNLLGRDDLTRRKILSIRESAEGTENSVRERYRLLRDLIISCNHTFSDIMELARIQGSPESKSGLWLLFLSFLGSKFSKIKPISYSRNNFVILMESVLESLVLREYLKLTGMSGNVILQIDEPYIRFLTSKSTMFQEMKDSLAYFLKDQK